MIKRAREQEYEEIDSYEDEVSVEKKQKRDTTHAKGPSFNWRKGGSLSSDRFDSRVCLWCEEEFEDLETHYRESKACRPYVCQRCGRLFVSVEALRSHRDCHPGFPAISLVCVECDQRFITTGCYKTSTSNAPDSQDVSDANLGVCICTPCRQTKIRKEGRKKPSVRSTSPTAVVTSVTSLVSERPPSEYFADMISSVLQKRSIMLCDKCNFVTKDAASLEEHKRSQHSEQHSWSQSGGLRRNESVPARTQEPSNRSSGKTEGYKDGQDSQGEHSAASFRNNPKQKKDDVFPCPFCSEPGRSLGSMVDHWRIHQEYIFYDIACDVCGSYFHSVRDLSQHLTRQHEKRHVQVCPICGEKFFSSASWNFHITAHTEAGDFRQSLSKWANPRFKNRKVRLFKCDRCGDTFKSDKALKEHLHQRHSFLCQFCEKVFMVGHALVTHLQRHEQYMFYNFKCTACDVLCESFFGLENHITTHLYRRQSFLCGICGATFAVLKEREDHLEGHRGEAICGENVRVRDVKAAKQTQGRIACRTCEALFSDKKQYAIHAKVNHHLPFVCQYCSEAFSSSSALAAHCHQHEEYPLRGFRCSSCRKRFISQETLEDHLSTVHEGRPVFLCCLCCEKFHDSQERLQHELLHGTDDVEAEASDPVRLPFGCEKCSSLFQTKDLRRRHYVTAHGTEFSAPLESSRQGASDPTFNLYRCSICGKSFGSLEGMQYHNEKNHKK